MELQKTQRYYKIKARGGHVGAGKSVELTFYIKAPNYSSAMQQVRNMPAVQHNRGDAILSVCQISEEEYNKNRENYSAYDVYNRGGAK